MPTISTIAILMMENRSFDHMLGWLSHPAYGNRPEVDGISLDIVANSANLANGTVYLPHPISTDDYLNSDPPHEREFVATQLGALRNNRYSMDGFVATSFATGGAQVAHPTVMGFHTPALVPVSAFLAGNFCVCDRWFAPLPTSTQPNRAMAFAGYTRKDFTGGRYPLNQGSMFQWLSQDANSHITWDVYHQGALSFFALMPSTWVHPTHFKRFGDLQEDAASGRLPNVVIIEPDYVDIPPELGGTRDCDHAPLPVRFGEDLLARVYRILKGSPRWPETVLLVTFDEHGGMFDHVSPPLVPYALPAPNDLHTQSGFVSTGVRVPGFIVSPLVAPGSVFHGMVDHTCMLDFIAHTFAGGEYSPEVSQRISAGNFASFSAALRPEARTDAAATAEPPAVPGLEAPPAVPSLDTDSREAFRGATRLLTDANLPVAMASFAQLPDGAAAESVFRRHP